MSRFLTGLLVALAVTLVGCGGGGGGSSSAPTDTGGGGTTKDPTNRTIIGKVVSSATGSPAVAHVVISLGERTVETGGDGIFRIGPIPLDEEIPSTFMVDVSGVGVGFIGDDLITYNGQEYLFNAVDIPVGVRNGDTDDLGTLTARYSPDGTPMIPYPIKDTVIAGRVVRSDTPSVGIAGVTVTFGTAVTTQTVTGKGGYFALNVGRDVNVISLFMASDKTFSISVPAKAVPGLIGAVQVSYGGQISAANNIPVPDDVLWNLSTDLGNVVVLIGDSSGGGGGDDDNPPPPP
ncbi:MAG: hypothetical protein NT018_14290 [Armatimonadetes bacterium]|nr:hypothetical protein [Armatimonadota bacterium]